jgi:hypothetical protein
MPEYRFVFAADSHVRLMQKPSEPPGAARFAWGPTDSVRVRDMLDELDGVPRHRILGIQVTCQGDNLDDEFAHANELAESTLILLSCAARAPTGSADFVLAYEVTADADERAFLQWIDVPELPQARTAAPQDLLGELLYKVQEASVENPALGQRVMLSMSWYRRALRETDVLFRFTNLWLALEALNPRLCDHFQIPKDQRKGLPGMKRLLSEVSGTDETFDKAVEARNDLLHVNRVLPDDIRRNVEPAIPTLDQALVDGWRRLLDLSETTSVQSSVWPNPVRFVVRATIRPDDEGWSDNRPPHVEIASKLELLEPDGPGDLTFTVSPTWTLHNMSSARDIRYELRGPETPNPLKATDADSDSQIQKPA